MKKLCVGLIALILTACVVAPVGYRAPIIVSDYNPMYVPEPACCVYYSGVYGFWYGGFFYEQRYWRPHYFPRGEPHRFETRPCAHACGYHYHR